MRSSAFFFYDTATPHVYPLSLHDALPISVGADDRRCELGAAVQRDRDLPRAVDDVRVREGVAVGRDDHARRRSEEHTSELQSPYDLVCRLLLEKKKKLGATTECRYHRSPR